MKCNYCGREFKNNGSRLMHEKSCKAYQTIDKELLSKLYYDDLLTLKEISKMFPDLGGGKIRDIIIKNKRYKKPKQYKTSYKKCEYCNKNISAINYKRHIKKHEYINKIALDVINDYLNGLSFRKLNEKYKIHRKSINQILIENNVQKRSLSDANKMAHTLYPNNFKLSDNTKRKISEIHKKNNYKYNYKKYFKNKRTILYYVLIENKYYKIGITTRTVDGRMRKVKYKLIKQWIFEDGEIAVKCESLILKMIKQEDKLNENIKILREGNSEIFTKDYIKEINKIVEKYL